jgi:hypothetical protein
VVELYSDGGGYAGATACTGSRLSVEHAVPRHSGSQTHCLAPPPSRVDGVHTPFKLQSSSDMHVDVGGAGGPGGIGLTTTPVVMFCGYGFGLHGNEDLVFVRSLAHE